MEAVAFKPRARLMSQLGDQLIKDENIAVLELIKNSYDADAKNVRIFMENLDEPNLSRIIIEDDGDGMSLEIVKNCWMEPGTDFKEEKLKDMLVKKIKSKLNRLPMGEKGIGRFGVHKLGNKITLITRSDGNNEVYFQIDWDDFNSSKYLSDVPINIFERKATNKFINDSPTGTKIIIERLKGSWTRGKIRDLQRSITSLNSPFKALDSFNVELKVDNEDWLKGLLKYEEIKDYALFKASMKISGNKIKNYKYEFKPWNSLSKLEERVEIDEIDMVLEQRVETEKGKKRKELIPIDLSQYNIGDVEIELLSFDLDSSIYKLGDRDLSGLKKYMSSNGGIFVYRDNIRVYSSGENDWLGLESKRLNAPGDKISANLVLGSVNLYREHSSDLREKTNREGFIEDAAYNIFREAVLFAVQKFERDRAIDKQYLRKYYGVTSKSEPVIAEITTLKEKINVKIQDNELKKEIYGCLDNIEKEYKHITEVYQKSSSAGLSMSVVLHEIEKILAELEYVINSEKTSDHVKSLVKRLGNLTDGYASVVKSKSIRAFNLKKMIDQSLYMIDFRLSAHEVEIDKSYLSIKEKIMIKGNESLLASTIINIIDNSIWWLHYAKVSNKKIYIDITKDITGYISVIIADNGKGFTIPTDIIARPFITDKPGGMGLGLHLASEIMKQHGGILYFPDFNDIKLPIEYKQGAIIALSFKEE
ncbi:MAG: ATP-binding protein [Candidatus Pristimantibacillus sp.]